MGRVAGKVALVTGGGSGLGRADCEALAREGATVIVTDVALDAAQRVAGEIGGGAVAFSLDVASEQAWIDVLREIEERFGRLDILVNNARSEESREGQECGSTCRSRWSQYH